jgi:cobalt-zinc-cadmium efflux system outer membrane protein
MEIPTDLPGADVPPIRLPPTDARNPQLREQATARLYPQLPDLGPRFQPEGGPQLPALTLQDLERMARDNSPTVRQAAADIRTAQGTALQAGLYPNPTIGYEGDNIGTNHTAGFQGGFVEQLIKTGGKLDLARAAAVMDVSNAQVALHRADADLMAKVRTNYFAVLVAQENIRISHALAEFSDETYRVQVDMVKGGQAAAYEPLQLRVLAYQARANLVQARNRYIAAWKQLSATLGLPGMPPMALAGRVDAPVPVLHYDTALARVLTQHTDVATAENTLQQARINLRLAEANRIPDVTLHIAVQNDPTVPPLDTTDVNAVVSAPIPLWDRNQGNIMAADGSLAKALEGPHLARTNLVNQVADAFERYQDNMVLVDYYRKQILPDQMQAYRGTRERYDQETDAVQFSDLVTSQQTVASTVTSYVTALGSLWTAVVDMSALLQAEDLFQMGELQALPQVPDLANLCPLPCCHGCQASREALGADGNWPPTAPGAVPMQPAPMQPGPIPPGR